MHPRRPPIQNPLKEVRPSNLCFFSKLRTLWCNGALATLLESVVSALFPMRRRVYPPRRFAYPLKSSVVKVYPKKAIYLPLESTLTKNPGGGHG
jgi:hypothetical protein